MPEVSLETSHWVLKNLAQRGAEVHLDTQLSSAVDGVIELSTGESFESDVIVWTAGVMANPQIVRNTDLPIEERGRLMRPDLRVGTDDEIVEDAWGAGDVSAVPDLTGGGVGGFCVPNAQHAVRQGKLLAKNLVAVLRGEPPREYFHKNLGAVAGLGLGVGVFQSGKIAIKGLLAWFMHRGYHGLAMPSWERKIRVFVGWSTTSSSAATSCRSRPCRTRARCSRSSPRARSRPRSRRPPRSRLRRRLRPRRLPSRRSPSRSPRSSRALRRARCDRAGPFARA